MGDKKCIKSVVEKLSVGDYLLQTIVRKRNILKLILNSLWAQTAFESVGIWWNSFKHENEINDSIKGWVIHWTS